MTLVTFSWSDFWFLTYLAGKMAPSVTSDCQGKFEHCLLPFKAWNFLDATVGRFFLIRPQNKAQIESLISLAWRYTGQIFGDWFTLVLNSLLKKSGNKIPFRPSRLHPSAPKWGTKWIEAQLSYGGSQKLEFCSASFSEAKAYTA